MVGLLDCWIAGLLDCWIVGLLDCWIAGLLDCWIAGLLDCWIVGLLDCWICWIVGLLDCWIAGLLDCWIVGLLDCWIAGLLDCWIVGLLDCWIVGLLDCWIAGLLDCWSLFGRNNNHSGGPSLALTCRAAAGYRLFALLHRFGNRPFRISLIAGCHADEPTSTHKWLLRHLVSFLSRLEEKHPLLKNYSWWIVLCQPDGEAANRRWYSGVLMIITACPLYLQPRRSRAAGR